MAMTLAIPTCASSPASSDDLANLPRTPITPPTIQTLSLPDSSSQMSQQQSHSATTQKRKPSRRANTAERRATHNAVERQRRETLNGRFLDLAGLLPNLSQIRRPSKSSIVNSSIAHVHASRRHRMLAARELRIVKLEADALRRELNEWRDRAALPRVEEPMRGEGFAMVMSGELEVLAAINDDEDDQDGEGYDGYNDGQDDYMGGNMMEEHDDRHSMLKNANATLFAQSVSAPNSAHPMMISIPRSAGPMVASNAPTVSFENPAMAALYEPHSHGNHFGNGHFIQQHQHLENDKVAAWNPQLYTQLNGNNNGNNNTLQQQQMMSAQQQRLYTPPHSAHSLSPAATDAAFFANFQRQQQQMVAMQHQQQQQQQQMMYGSDGDDSSSVGSGPGERARSGSLSGSGYGSPVHMGSSPSSYELSPLSNPEYVSRRLSANLHVNTSLGFDGMGMMKNMPMSAGHVGSFMI